ncbi:MAG: divalent-cation tolerance protein CutA [candidate division WOR-3 bacterium]|nr:divalent-cation tolerance protein CutA [candidate division WOR-3 bacterium]
MEQRNDYIQIFTTVEKKEDAEKIARSVVEKRLGGCVQILGPIKSTYWWKGKIETAEEYLCIVKSKKDLYDKLEKAIKEIHPYETPEIIALPIIAGYEGYLRWLNGELKSGDS